MSTRNRGASHAHTRNRYPPDVPPGRGHRPDAEILIASPEYLDGQAKSFAPHAVVRNDDGEELGIPEGVVCWVGVTITDSSMDARISAGGRETYAHDATVEELIRALDEAEVLVPEEDGGRPG